MSVRGDELNSLYVEPERHEREIAWAALEFVDVFKIFRSGPVETVALRGLRLRVEHGELVAVLGPSGCGKTTMLSLAAALDQPSAGEVRVGEHPLGRLDEEALADFRAREVAIVFQRDNLWPWLTARENIAVSLQLAGNGAARASGAGRRANRRAGRCQRAARAGCPAQPAHLLRQHARRRDALGSRRARG